MVRYEEETAKGSATLGSVRAAGRWWSFSFWSQVTLFIYYQVIEWVNLYPWNDVRRGNGQGTLDLVVGAVLIGAILATFLKARWVVGGVCALYALWLWLQIESWWVPYRICPDFRGKRKTA